MKLEFINNELICECPYCDQSFKVDTVEIKDGYHNLTSKPINEVEWNENINRIRCPICKLYILAFVNGTEIFEGVLYDKGHLDFMVSNSSRYRTFEFRSWSDLTDMYEEKICKTLTHDELKKKCKTYRKLIEKCELLILFI